MNYVPLSLIAAEVGRTVDELAHQFGTAVVIDAGTGLQCIAPDVARTFLTARRAAIEDARQREIASREEARRQPHATRARIRAVAASQRPFAGSDAPAVERMMGDEHSGREQLYGGGLAYHSFSRKD